MGVQTIHEETWCAACSDLLQTISSPFTASSSLPPDFMEPSDTASHEHETAVRLGNTRIHVQITEVSEGEELYLPRYS